MSLPMYSLAIAHTNDFLQQNERGVVCKYNNKPSIKECFNIDSQCVNNTANKLCTGKSTV